MFLEGKDPKAAIAAAAGGRHVGHRRLQRPRRGLTPQRLAHRPCLAPHPGIDRGVHMRGWQRWAGSGLAAVVLAAGLSTVAAPGAGAANSTSCPLNALKKASKPVEITMWHSMNRANGDTLQQLTDDVQRVAERREGQPGQPDRLRADLHQVQGRPLERRPPRHRAAAGDRPAADDRHADGAAGERVRQGRQVQLLRLPAPGDQLLHRGGHAVRDAVQHLGPCPLLQQEGVLRRRPGSEHAAEDARRRARRGREAQERRASPRRSGSRPSPASSSTGGRWPTSST